MCGGRLNNVTRLDCVTMSTQERTALLDSAYHPVLSFPYDVPLSVHFESLLKTGEWQQKPPPKSLRILPNDKRRAKYNKERVRKYTKRLSKSSSAVFLSSAKIRSKYEQKQLARSQSSASLPSGNSPTATSPMSTGSDITALQRKRKAIGADGLRRRSLPNSTPRHRSASTSILSYTPNRRDNQSPFHALREVRDSLKKKRTESAYDINNIVIPYSIASSVRVEKLQYKEIITPKWRKLSNGEEACSSPPPQPIEDDVALDNDLVVKENGDSACVEAEKASPAVKAEPLESESDVVDVCAPAAEDSTVLDEIEPEDLGDDAYVIRHLKCEIAEKKRFSTFPTTNRRGRANVHKSESSANLSLPPGCEQMSPELLVAPPPDTLPHLVASSPATPTITPGAFAASLDEESKTDDPSLIRKRSMSVSSRSGARSRSTSHSEEFGIRVRKASATVNPWAARTFPLAEGDMQELTRNDMSPVSSARRCVFGTDTPSSSGTPLMTPCHSNVPSDAEEAMDEDPDDPEWTVISEQRPIAATMIPKTSIVLKLAKR